MKNKSFTLIELLVVIVIIGILAGVIIVSTSSSISKASIAKSKVFSESLRNELILNLKMEFSFDSIEGSSAPYTTNDDWGGKSMTCSRKSTTARKLSIKGITTLIPFSARL